MSVKVYMNNINELGEEDNLIAEGIVKLKNKELVWTKVVKWNCRINEMGILHKSEV